MFGTRKINVPIDFPTATLDLSSYVLSAIQGSNEHSLKAAVAEPDKQTGVPPKVIYDLYGISNHYGTMNGGHYTAMCENPITKQWYEFDDSTVSKMASSAAQAQSAVNNKAAYVLFYRRRHDV
jgi:ubiquitin C-terminal hydrolase